MKDRDEVKNVDPVTDHPNTQDWYHGEQVCFRLERNTIENMFNLIMLCKMCGTYRTLTMHTHVASSLISTEWHWSLRGRPTLKWYTIRPNFIQVTRKLYDKDPCAYIVNERDAIIPYTLGQMFFIAFGNSGIRQQWAITNNMNHATFRQFTDVRFADDIDGPLHEENCYPDKTR